MWRLSLNKNTILFFLLILIFAIPILLPLVRPGFFQSDDGEWMVIRFSAFHEAFRDGQIPVRFLGRLNYGYGYPVANFLYPGFLYLAEPFHIIGFDFVETIKILFGLTMVGSAIFTYLWLSRLFGRWEAFVGAIVYLYAPYHLYDLYTRGSMGELLALAILPFLFWQIERKSFFWLSVGVGLLLLSHNTLALLFLPIVVLYLLLQYLLAKKKHVWHFFGPLVIGFGLAAFFWIPALYDLQYTIFSQTPVSDWSNYFADYMLVGISLFLILIATLVLIVSGTIKATKHRLTIIMTPLAVVSIFFALSVSTMFWSVLPVSFIQFPFRFLSVAVVCFAFLSACVLSVIQGRYKIVAGIGILLLTFFSAISYISPKVFFEKPDSLYATNEDTTTVKNEYMPKWVSGIPTSRFAEKVVVSNGIVSDLQTKTNRVSFHTYLEEDSRVAVNTVYFPGWHAFVDEQEVPIDYENNGLITFLVPSGEHTVRVVFSETPVRLISDMISIVSVILLMVFAFVYRRNDEKRA